MIKSRPHNINQPTRPVNSRSENNIIEPEEGVWSHNGDQPPDQIQLERFRQVFRIKPLALMSRKLPEQAIEGILYRGGKLLIGGGSKANKTFGLMHLAWCAANGLCWLNWKMPKGKVLFINFELFEAEAATRFDRIREAVGEGNQDNIEVACLRGKLTSVEEIGKYVKAIKHCEYQLIVIDPAYKLLHKRDENTAKDVADLLNRIERVAEQANVAIAIAQHFSKGNQSMKEAIDRLCGSGVWGRDPDALIILTAHKQLNCYVVDIILRSFPPVDSFVLRFEFPVFKVDETLNPEELKESGGKKKGQFVKEYTDEELSIPFRQPGTKQQLTMTEWVDGLKTILNRDINRRTLYRRLKDPGFPVWKVGKDSYQLRGGTTR